jgi:hypothetical protein
MIAENPLRNSTGRILCNGEDFREIDFARPNCFSILLKSCASISSDDSMRETSGTERVENDQTAEGGDKI